ncbi:MAG TPA: hypothetical protein VF695_10040 [Sphingomonas sp.]|jgi:hypothetical protein
MRLAALARGWNNCIGRYFGSDVDRGQLRQRVLELLFDQGFCGSHQQAAVEIRADRDQYRIRRGVDRANVIDR